VDSSDALHDVIIAPNFMRSSTLKDVSMDRGCGNADIWADVQMEIGETLALCAYA